MTVPVRTLLSGMTDASGNATIPINAPPTMYGVLTLVATCPGNPTWTVKAGGQLLLVGNGPNVNLGPTLTNPNELLTITVSSATPNAQVTGTLAGTAHLSAEEAAEGYVPLGNPLTVNTAMPPIVLGSIRTVGGGDTVNKTFPLPPGVQAVGWSVQFVGFGNPGTISITGHDTGHTYLSASNVSGAPEDFEVAILSEADGSIDCSVTSQAQPDLVFFLGFVQNPVTFPQARPDNSTNTPFVRMGGTPAAWQVPTDASVSLGSVLNGGATSTLVSGVANQRIRVFDVYFEGTGITTIHYQDSNSKRIIAGQAFAANQTSIPPSNCGGRPCGFGNSLQLVNDTGTATTHTSTVGWSQAA